MMTASEIAIACCASGARLSGRNHTTIGTMTARMRPQMTTERGGRSSKGVAATAAGIVSVVNEASVAQNLIKDALASAVERCQGQPYFGTGEQSHACHHVFERDRITVDKNRL